MLISLIFYIPIWNNDTDARLNRDRVNELISVGLNHNWTENMSQCAATSDFGRFPVVILWWNARARERKRTMIGMTDPTKPQGILF